MHFGQREAAVITYSNRPGRDFDDYSKDFPFHAGRFDTRAAPGIRPPCAADNAS